MGIINKLYAKDIKARKESLELSFGNIDMRTPGYVEIKEWDEATGETRTDAAKDNMDLYAALVLKQWSGVPEIVSATEEDIVSDIKKHFTGDDVTAVIEWWLKISGISRISGEGFQQRR